MNNSLPIQAEEVVIPSDIEFYDFKFKKTPRCLMVQVYDKDGMLKNVKVSSNIVYPTGKFAYLKEGDTIHYIAVE